MASPSFSVLLAFLFIVSLSHAQDLITKVCSKTLNQQLCLQTLKSDPNAPGADLKGLGFIAIAKSLSDAQNTHNLVVSLSKQAGGDAKLKDRYDTCTENYSDAVSNLGNAKQALTSGDISTFRTAASAALDGPGTCEDSFEGPPSAPAQLQQANKNSQGLIGIVLAVGALLAGE